MNISKGHGGRRIGYSKISFSEIVYMAFIVVLLWVAATTMVQRFKDPKLTETELFLKIPNSAILHFTKGVK